MRFDIRHPVALAAASILVFLSQTAWGQDGSMEPEVAVTVAKVQRATLQEYVTAYGTIETAPAGQGTEPAGARIAAPVSGIVSEVTCHEGLRVEKGAVLCSLDSRMARAEVERAEQSLSLAERTYQRQKELEASGATSEKNVQAAETELTNARSDLAAARIVLSLHQITAPFAGTITRLDVAPGESVDTGTIVAELADLSRLTAALQVPVFEARLLKPGQAVEIQTENSDAPVPGELTTVSPRVDAATGAVTAYVALPEDTSLQPGRFVSGRVAADAHRGCLAVPESSVVKDADAGWVIAVVTDGRAMHMAVETGYRENGLVEVSGGGLSEGMTVVAVGAYGLSDGTRIRVAENTETEAGK